MSKWFVVWGQALKNTVYYNWAVFYDYFAQFNVVITADWDSQCLDLDLYLIIYISVILTILNKLQALRPKAFCLIIDP